MEMLTIKYRTVNAETGESFMFDTLKEADRKLCEINLSGNDELVPCYNEEVWPGGYTRLIHQGL